MRVSGWESLLNTFLETPVAFAWGEHDCALWSADWVALCTGRDFGPDWRGLYASEAELTALLAFRGLASYQDIPGSVGLEEIAPGFAQRGDIVLHAQGCLGIANGVWSFFLTAGGLTRLRTRDCVRAWAVR